MAPVAPYYGVRIVEQFFRLGIAGRRCDRRTPRARETRLDGGLGPESGAKDNCGFPA